MWAIPLTCTKVPQIAEQRLVAIDEAEGEKAFVRYYLRLPGWIHTGFATRAEEELRDLREKVSRRGESWRESCGSGLKCK